MQFTKTEAQLANRRARIAELYAQGRVMNSTQKAKIQKEQKRAQALSDKADLILAGILASNVPSHRYNEIQAPVKVVAPEATSQLKVNQKQDALAAKANQVLAELLG